MSDFQFVFFFFLPHSSIADLSWNTPSNAACCTLLAVLQPRAQPTGPRGRPSHCRGTEGKQGAEENKVLFFFFLQINYFTIFERFKVDHPT
jgi:hypothetical protein